MISILDLLVPADQSVHMYGPPSSGKTSICLYIGNQYIKENNTVVYIDSKGDVDPQQAEQIAPGITMAHTTTSFKNVTEIIAETGAKLLILDDLTQFFLKNSAVTKFLTAVHGRKCRAIVINQIRETPGSGSHAYFDNKLEGFGYSIHCSRKEKIDDGFIYGLRCPETKKYVEVVIYNDGHIDEFFTYRPYILDAVVDLGLQSQLHADRSTEAIRHLFNHNRRKIMAQISNKFKYQPPVWI